MGASPVPGKNMAVFGLCAVLNRLRALAAGRLRWLGLGPPYRVHVASTRGTTRDMEMQWFDMALKDRSLLLDVHVKA